MLFGVLNMSVRCNEYDVSIFFYSLYCLFVILLWSQVAGVDILGMFPCTEEYMRLSFSLDLCWIFF